MIKQRSLSVDIRNYWHVGTGRGSGSHLDALVERDTAGLPFVSGKMLKGLLRDAVRRVAEWQVFEPLQSGAELPNSERLVEYLFGTAGFHGEDELPQGESYRGLPRNDTKSGILKFSDARMSPELIEWLQGNSPEHQQLRDGLFRSLYSTAINKGSGVAKKGSLRGQQVTVPMLLESRISVIDSALINNQYPQLAEEWHNIIEQALPLVRAVGANRTRGLGRAKLALRKEVVS